MTLAQIAAKPADKRTPIEQAIWNIDIQIATFKEVEDIADHAPAVLRIIKPIREMLDKLLPSEREAIEAAYNQGNLDSYVETREEKYDYVPSGNAQDYFDKTYS